LPEAEAETMSYYNSGSNVLKAFRVKLSEKKFRINPPEDWDEEEEEKLLEEEISKANRESAEIWAKELENIGELKEQILAEGQEEADKVIELARKESMEIVAKAVMEGNAKRGEIMEEARKEGYEEGVGQGRKDGEALKEEASEVLEDARRTREEMIAGVEGELINLVIDISEKLLRDKASFSPELILCLIKAGLSETTTSDDITIRVSQDDYEGVLEQKEELMKMISGGAKLEIIRDMALGKSDCVIETAYGYIDSSLDQQLTSLREKLFYIRNL
jgi:flagellar assembly protein FliH